MVTFPDFHYGVTQGDTLEEAVDMAEDLLAGLISDLVSRSEDLPKPGRRRGRHYRAISLPALRSAKVEFYQAFRNSGIRTSELARRIGIPKSNLDRLFDLFHYSRLGQIEAAFTAWHKKLRIDVQGAV